MVSRRASVRIGARVPRVGHPVQYSAMRVPIVTFRLANGLFVTLSEDHTAPIVAVNLWYHVGSANERAGRTGFAHLFEHMLFQGSAHVAANEHFELIQRAGGGPDGRTCPRNDPAEAGHAARRGEERAPLERGQPTLWYLVGKTARTRLS